MIAARSFCHRCRQLVRGYDDKRTGQFVLERHAAPGQEHLAPEQRKPCGSTAARIATVERRP